MTKAIFCWSGGKDSALALHKVRITGQYEIVSLLTTVNGEFNRISMHGVREALLDQQAAALGLPLRKVHVFTTSNDEYEQKMRAMLLEFKARGVEAVMFGDIFLEDLRAWRDSKLALVGLTGVYPLWKIPTTKLIQEFFQLGFKAVICCVNDAYLGEAVVGQDLSPDLIATWPANVDPCGENGEYHSFVYAGPIFTKPLRVRRCEKVFRPMPAPAGDHPPPVPQSLGFWFCELVGDEHGAEPAAGQMGSRG